MRWIHTPPPTDEVGALSRDAGVSPVLAELLWRLEVKDAAEVKDYVAQQGEVAREVVEGYVADAKVVTQLNQEAAEEVRKVVDESITNVSKKAA